MAVAVNRLVAGIEYEPLQLEARDHGAVGDGVTDDTVALQAFIDTLQAGLNTVTGINPLVGRLSGGTYLFTTLNITRPIAIEGAENLSTVLLQVDSEANPGIKVRMAHGGDNYYTSRNIPATLVLRNLRIEGGDQLSGDAGQYGLDLQDAGANPITTRVVLDNVSISRFAGHGINGASFTGWVDGDKVVCHNNNLHGMSANSCSDWHFVNSDFHSNSSSGVLLSGCGWFNFVACNMWSNILSGLHLFSTLDYATHTFVGGSIDHNEQRGVLCDMRNGGTVMFHGTSFLDNSQEGDEDYNEIQFAAAATGKLTFNGCAFGRTFSQQTVSTEKSQYHFGFAGAGGAAVVDPATHFAAGLATTNAAGQIHRGVAETEVSVAIAAGVLTINLALGSVFRFTNNANITTFTISNAPAGAASFTLEITANGTGYTQDWGSVVWPSGTAPTLTTTNAKVDILSFAKFGSVWRGFTAGQNYA